MFTLELKISRLESEEIKNTAAEAVEYGIALWDSARP